MIVHIVLDGVADGALGVGLDVIGAAARLARTTAPARSKLLHQRVASIDGRPVRSGNGRVIAADAALARIRARPGDVLVLPGLSATTATSIDQLLRRADVQRCIALVTRARTRGATIAASCSATFVLAASGLLADQPATTTWWLAPLFARRFPDVDVHADRMVVEGDRVLTAGSAFAHADLMLALLSRIAGPTLAHTVARYLVLDERTSQSRYMVLDHLRTHDPILGALERFVTRNLQRQLTLRELARATATSPRTLARRVQLALGMTPLALVRRLRVQRAAHLLETTRASVEDVAARVGYADPAAFRRVFRRHLGHAPRRRP